MTTENTTPPPSVLKLDAVMARTSLSRSMVYELMDAKEFPQRIKLGKRAVGWIEGEVSAWINQRAQQRRA